MGRGTPVIVKTRDFFVIISFPCTCRGQAQLKLQRKPTTASGLRQEISQFLPLVRFFTMTSEEFVQSVVTSDVLTPDESVFILKNIANPEGDISPLSSFTSNTVKINTSRETRAHPITKVSVVKSG